MLYLLIILIALALILTLITFPYTVISIHYKELKLDILVKHWLFKRNFQIDLEKGKEKEVISGEVSKEKDKKQSFDIKAKIEDIKGRVFSPETGFNMEEARAVKNELFETYSDIADIVKKFFDKTRLKIHIPVLRIKLEYGTGNPANTGIIYGSIWGAVGILYPILARHFHIAYPQLDITPDFYGKRFNTEIKSIIKVRPTHIINAAFSTLWSPMLTYLKNNFKKGREKNGR